MTGELCCPAETFILFKAAAGISGLFTYDMLGLMPLSPEGRTVHWFILQLLKSSILLFPLIYLAGVVRAGLNPAKAKRFLEGKSRIFSYLAAALLGMITPFCSCAAVPIFAGFAASGIRRGAAAAFLVTAPLVSESGLILIGGSMGIGFAVLTAAAGGAVGITAGYLFDFLEDHGKSAFLPVFSDDTDRWSASERKSWVERHRWALRELKKVGVKIFPWLAVSMLAASLMRVYVPAELIGLTLSGNHWWSVPAAVLAGIPIYGTVGTAAPIASVLLEKGAAPGTVFAFMLAVSGVSLPEFILIKQVLTAKGLLILLALFLFSFTIIGYAVNAAQLVH